MSDLPDDLWRKVLHQGIKNTKLTYKDLCSISMTCSHLHRLSSEQSLWCHLLCFDFRWTFYYPSPFPFSLLQKLRSSISAKSQYRTRLEIAREREWKQKKWRMALLEEERRFVEIYNDPFEFLERLLLLKNIEVLEGELHRIRTVLEQKYPFDNDILSAKIQEIELAKEKKMRKPTDADLFNSTKVNSKAFECVPNRRYPRERRSKAFTKQTKSWHR